MIAVCNKEEFLFISSQKCMFSQNNSAQGDSMLLSPWISGKNEEHWCATSQTFNEVLVDYFWSLSMKNSQK